MTKSPSLALVLPLTLLLAACSSGGGPPKTVLPDVLTRRFAKDPEAARASLVGRAYRVRSRILLPGRSQLVLEGGSHEGHRLPSLRCDLEPDQEDAASALARGTLVTVTGTLTGYDAALSSVRLDGCRIER